MTQREIKNFIDRHSFYPVTGLDVKKFCSDNGFRPYDVDHIVFTDVCHFCFVFKKYFKYESITFTNYTFLSYLTRHILESEL